MLELLNQLDGFEATNQIKVVMATNRIDILDSALLRPGRIDRKIEFPNPTAASRVDIMSIHSRKMNLLRGIDLHKIAEKMTDASGAECNGVCSEAGMFAPRERRCARRVSKRRWALRHRQARNDFGTPCETADECAKHPFGLHMWHHERTYRSASFNARTASPG